MTSVAQRNLNLRGQGLEGSSYLISKDYYQYLQGPTDLGTSYQTTFRKPLRGSNYLTGRGANYLLGGGANFFGSKGILNKNYEANYYGRGNKNLNAFKGRGFFSNIWNGLKKGVSTISGLFKRANNTNIGRAVINGAKQAASNVIKTPEVQDFGRSQIERLPGVLQGPAQGLVNQGMQAADQFLQPSPMPYMNAPQNMGYNPYYGSMPQGMPQGMYGMPQGMPQGMYGMPLAMNGMQRWTGRGIEYSKRKRPRDFQDSRDDEGKTFDDLKNESDDYLQNNLLNPFKTFEDANEEKGLFAAISSLSAKNPGYPNLHHFSESLNDNIATLKKYSIPKVHQCVHPNERKFSAPSVERYPDLIQYDKSLIDPQVVKMFQLHNAKIQRHYTNPLQSQKSNIEWEKKELFPNHYSHAHDMFALHDASIHRRNLDKVKKSDDYNVGEYSYFNPNISSEMDKAYGKDTIGSGVFRYGYNAPGMTYDVRKKRWELTGGAAFKSPTPGWKYKTGGWMRGSLPMFAYEANQVRGPFGLDLQADEAQASENAEQEIALAPRNESFAPSSSWGNYALAKQAYAKSNRINKTAPSESSFINLNAGKSFEQAHLQNMLKQQEAVDIASEIEHEQGQYGKRFNKELPTANGQITQAAFDPAVSDRMELARMQSQLALSAQKALDATNAANAATSAAPVAVAGDAGRERVAGMGIKTRESNKIKGGSLMGIQKVESNNEISDKYQDYIKQLM